MHTRALLLVLSNMIIASCARLAPETITLAPKLQSQYVLQHGHVAHDQPVVQTDLTVTAKSQLYASVFHSAGLNDADLSGDGGDEVDWTVGWNDHLLPANAHANLSLSYYDLTEVFQFPGDDLLVPQTEVWYEFPLAEHTVSPLIRGWAFMPVSGVEYSTWLVGSGVRHRWPIAERLAMEHAAVVAYEAGRLPDTDAGWLLDYSGSLGWEWSERVTLFIPGVRITDPLTRVRDGREFELVVWAGLSFTWSRE